MRRTREGKEEGQGGRARREGEDTRMQRKELRKTVVVCFGSI